MNWFNFYTPKARSDAFTDATDAQVGAWFRLVIHCCEQENGGMIHGASKWNARKWMSTTGVEHDVIMADSPLWHFSQIGSLIVADYPSEKEDEIRKKRIAGKRTAAIRWAKKKKPKTKGDNSSATSSATSSLNAEGEREGEGEDKPTPSSVIVFDAQNHQSRKSSP